ncbi:MAG TPA: hypothetical protein VNO30_47650 [Kofleriaceae bacterium]|nr:hypothetical protein [Kofleriaceae bacterium]
MAKSLYNPDKYTYRVIWSEEDQEHVGLCAEFPSLSHLAESAPEALAGIMKLVGTVLSDMAKSKEEIPEPLSLRQFKGNVAVRIRQSAIAKLAMAPRSKAHR